MPTQRPREYLRPRHLRMSQCHLDLVADVDEEAEAVDDADEDATGEEQASSHTPRPITNRQQDSPQHKAKEEFPPLPEEAADVEEAAGQPRTQTKDTTIGARVLLADLTCPDGTIAKLAQGRAWTATRKDTLARRVNNTLTQGTSLPCGVRTRSISQSQARSGANDW